METVKSYDLTSSEVYAVVTALYSRFCMFIENYSSNDMRVHKSSYDDYLSTRKALRKLGYGHLLKGHKLK